MSPDEVDWYASALEGCRRKGTPERPAWYVRDRLVARLADPTTLLIRVPLPEREEFLERAGDGFGVPPRLERHHEVEAYLDRASADAVREAIRLAWEFQRAW